MNCQFCATPLTQPGANTCARCFDRLDMTTGLPDLDPAHELEDDSEGWAPAPNPCRAHFYSPLGVSDRCTLAAGHAGAHENHDPRSPFFFDGHGHGTGERC